MKNYICDDFIVIIPFSNLIISFYCFRSTITHFISIISFQLLPTKISNYYLNYQNIKLDDWCIYIIDILNQINFLLNAD